MSLQVVNLKRKSPNELFCLLCDQPGNLINHPKKETFQTIKNAANRRKDNVQEKFDNLFDPNADEQCFSWHTSCLASYISEEKIRRREIALYKLQEESLSTSTQDETGISTQSTRRSIRQSESSSTLNCFICGHLKKNKDTKLFFLTEVSSATLIFNAARRKQDEVFTNICNYQAPEDLIGNKFKYHKACYSKYIAVPRNSSNKGGRPSTSMSQEQLLVAFEKLLVDIKDRISTNAFQLSYLAERMITLSEVEEAVISNRVVKSLLIDKFGYKIFFSYPTERNKSCLVFMAFRQKN